MKEITTSQTGTLVWTICRGSSNEVVDLSGVTPVVHLLYEGGLNKIPLDYTIQEDGSITASIGTLLPGVYGLRAYWQKSGKPLEKSEVRNVVFVEEQTGSVTAQTYTVKVKSYVNWFGYDGLNAYEMACMKEVITVSEDEWMESQTQAAEKYNELVSVTDSLQEQINEIIAGGSTQSISVSPSAFYSGQSTVITITGTSNKTMTSAELKQGDTSLKTASDVTSISATATITATTSFSLSGKVSGVTFSTKSATATAVLPIYMGVGAVYTDVTIDSKKLSARTSPAGTFHFSVTTAGQFVFFCVPSTMSISKATMNGFDFPLTSEAQTIDGNSYTVYKSNSMSVSSFSVVIS